MNDTAEPKTGGPKKVAILGGGVAGLVTAFEITSQPGWQERFDITVHQLGWRLGGKCASIGGPDGRIGWDGIHGRPASYYNALPLMAQAYAELGRAAGDPPPARKEACGPGN